MTDFDLNLLRVLVALDQTRHVTRAATLLDMSQSGFSTALARLRRQFGDPLFVRGSGGMAPTPRAQEMIRTAQDVLDSVRTGILDVPGFEPATTRTEFRLAMSDIGEIVFMPRLIPYLAAHAPGASVSCFPLPTGDLQAALESGEVDLAIGYYPDLHRQGFFQQRLYSHTFVCLMRTGHPVQRTRLTPRDFATLGHALASAPVRSQTLFDRFIDGRGIARRIVMRTPHFMTLPVIIAESDLIATVPLAVGTLFARYGMIRLVRPPFDPPSFLVQHWHRRFQRDPRNRWLRARIAELFNDAHDEWLAVERSLYGPIRRKAGAG